MLTPNVPDARDSVAVLTLAESGTTTTVVEVEKSVNTFVIATHQADDRASRKALRARGKIAGTILTFLDNETLVAVAPSVSITVAMVVIIVVVIITMVVFARGTRRSGGLGCGGRGRGRFATERTGVPFPIVSALGGRLIFRGTVRSTAALHR